MTPTASTAPPGADPWSVAALVHEQLTGLASRYDAAAQRLDAIASRCAALSHEDAWRGPGSRAFAARVQRHGDDTAQQADRCREAAESVRVAATLLAQRIQGVESVLDLGGALTGVLTAVLGPAALGTAALDPAALGAAVLGTAGAGPAVVGAAAVVLP